MSPHTPNAPQSPQEPPWGLLSLLASFPVTLEPQEGPPGPGLVSRPHMEVRPDRPEQLPRIIATLTQAGYMVIDHGLYVTTWQEGTVDI